MSLCRGLLSSNYKRQLWHCVTATSFYIASYTVFQPPKQRAKAAVQQKQEAEITQWHSAILSYGRHQGLAKRSSLAMFWLLLQLILAHVGL